MQESKRALKSGKNSARTPKSNSPLSGGSDSALQRSKPQGASSRFKVFIGNIDAAITQRLIAGLGQIRANVSAKTNRQHTGLILEYKTKEDAELIMASIPAPYKGAWWRSTPQKAELQIHIILSPIPDSATQEDIATVVATALKVPQDNISSVQIAILRDEQDAENQAMLSSSSNTLMKKISRVFESEEIRFPRQTTRVSAARLKDQAKSLSADVMSQRAIVVQNCHCDVTEEEIRAFFTVYGDVQLAAKRGDKYYVCFNDECGQENALELAEQDDRCQKRPLADGRLIVSRLADGDEDFGGLRTPSDRSSVSYSFKEEDWMLVDEVAIE